MASPLVIAATMALILAASFPLPPVNAFSIPWSTSSISQASRSTRYMTDSSASTPPSSYQRRQRYAGRYPRNFADKYKEHQGDADVMKKVLSKGMTPAGTHVPIMLQECMEHLGLLSLPQEMPEEPLIVDCTLGYGGHASHVLRLLADVATNSRLIAFDQDPIEIAKTEARLRQELEGSHNSAAAAAVTLTTVNQNFETLGSYLQGSPGTVTGLLADLGLSSMQIDDNTRGFTYKREGPLDMRMNTNATETAYDVLGRLTPKQFQRLLQENSDERFAAPIAKGLLGVENKKAKGRRGRANIPETTLELAQRTRAIVEPLLVAEKTSPKKLKGALDSTVARVLQAIRIEVNGEFRVLEALLEDLPTLLAPGGRAVFLTFHSGEDRRVKKAFKAGFKSGAYSSWSRTVVRASGMERRDNPRSSCCKLRWAIRSNESEEGGLTTPAIEE